MDSSNESRLRIGFDLNKQNITYTRLLENQTAIALSKIKIVKIIIRRQINIQALDYQPKISNSTQPLMNIYLSTFFFIQLM